MEEHVATPIHPANDNVRADHASVGGEPEAHPARGPHSHCERARLRLGIKVPEDLVHRFAVALVVAEGGAERVGREVDVSGLQKRNNGQEQYQRLHGSSSGQSQ